MAKRSYALWLMPTGEVKRQLATTILALSKEYSTPAFEPHVTLLGGIVGPLPETMTKAAKLAQLLHPFVLRLTTVGFLEEYFRCLFIRVAPTNLLVKAHRVASEVFQVRFQSAYMPHLSLMYGNLDPQRQESIIAALGRRLDFEFNARATYLYLIRGEPYQWRRVQAFDLRGGCT